ncbi:hypothetical protein EK904_006787 [Melospiza melodia maxima]|nr:hypothetical protein EK904_006787 [Melospiza melodia maxima]
MGFGVLLSPGGLALPVLGRFALFTVCADASVMIVYLQLGLSAVAVTPVGAEPCAGRRARRARSRRARRFPGKPAGLSAAPAPSGSSRPRSERAPIALNAVGGALLKSCRAGGRENWL